jgi:hypothetical protein
MVTIIEIYSVKPPQPPNASAPRRLALAVGAPLESAEVIECHYMTQPLVELYGGCMVVLKVSCYGKWYYQVAVIASAQSVRSFRDHNRHLNHTPAACYYNGR